MPSVSIREDRSSSVTAHTVGIFLSLALYIVPMALLAHTRFATREPSDMGCMPLLVVIALPQWPALGMHGCTHGSAPHSNNIGGLEKSTIMGRNPTPKSQKRVQGG